ncbi:hypothetical protein LG047_11295 [Methylocystis sp. WRRC1]|uniref:hypothetical protein n=1 Tax=unclassified Methylocystis TaxID=2625913 RepID=UPI0001F87FBD|nr:MULTISPECIES: hypothetical protein [unclassified Methylocystis]MCC3245910.1 hypothetical protein [Methylocystis sp. WRRC1]
MRAHPLFVAGLAAVALAGCNAGRSPQVATIPPGPPLRAPSAADFQSPEGSGCAGAISRYRSVIENDHSMGHVNQSVYNQIQGEISEASSACSGGQDAKALSLVRASKSRHGYPG